MNKKGDSQMFDVARKSIYWTIALVLISLLFLATLFVFEKYRKTLIEVPPQLPAGFIALRFTNIPECFAHVDPRTATVQTNSIDQLKFTESQLHTCYRTPPEKGYKTYNFRLVAEGREIKTNNYFFDGRDDFIFDKEVLWFEGGKIKSSILTIYVQEKIGTK